jgi:hypothetical protein
MPIKVTHQLISFNLCNVENNSKNKKCSWWNDSTGEVTGFFLFSRLSTGVLEKLFTLAHFCQVACHRKNDRAKKKVPFGETTMAKLLIYLFFNN